MFVQRKAHFHFAHGYRRKIKIIKVKVHPQNGFVCSHHITLFFSNCTIACHVGQKQGTPDLTDRCLTAFPNRKRTNKKTVKFLVSHKNNSASLSVLLSLSLSPYPLFCILRYCVYTVTSLLYRFKHQSHFTFQNHSSFSQNILHLYFHLPVVPPKHTSCLSYRQGKPSIHHFQCIYRSAQIICSAKRTVFMF